VVSARIWGPAGDTVLRLALDTGATSTMVSPAALVMLGYDPASVVERARMTTGSGVEYVPRMSIEGIEALGVQRTGLVVTCHTLPPTASVDGLLGLDYFRDCRLLIDFRAGEIILD